MSPARWLASTSGADSEEAANAFYTSDQFAPVREATQGGGMTSTPWPVHRIEV